MRSYFLLSPAKINLTLQVLNKREDNYHEIYTIFQKIDLFDEIEIRKGTSFFSLDFISEIPLPLEENLVYRAYKKFKEVFKIKDEVSIKIKKIIPMGAGLGGGSSNAGTVLRALAFLYGIDPESPILYKIAKSLGADVPFFLSPYPAAIGKGIGEILLPFPSFPAWYILICPKFSINTKWAYENLGLTKSKKPVYYSADMAPWYHPQKLINDFKELIYKKFKILEDYEKFLIKLGCCAVGLSGTGSTIFGIFEKKPPIFAYETLKKFLKDVKIFLAKNLEIN
ncbi:4-(cytidine 5'-diphospho)-2-C-methyl-D-erythritol kinase [Thermodesulfobacterium hydrogeniphilum]|uniref:4-(cytidine 5'-diphospho)-2-C-methyl-D-erythritol kinase n=1 Tax=Thermodesulfobacterium hydrogeniphilum TaxID=161156 RepID=UPI00056E92D4|nr:4-(cytidine 5'-diphospho)-2-C-methyl-D-erythritol kinase [Thermodesulfobacterium hydrogeniphilum]